MQLRLVKPMVVRVYTDVGYTLSYADRGLISDVLMRIASKIRRIEHKVSRIVIEVEVIE